MLTEAEARRREAGVTLWLAGLTPDVYAAIQRSPLGERLGREGLLFNVEIAVERYRSVPDGGPRGTTPTTAGGPNE